MHYQLWIEEADKAVWHQVTRGEPPEYRAVCGWTISALRGRLYPQKAGEPGPPTEQRCHDCVAGRTTPGA